MSHAETGSRQEGIAPRAVAATAGLVFSAEYLLVPSED